MILLEFALEARQEREGVGGRACEASQDAIIVEASHFARARFHDGFAERDLSIAC